MEQFLPSISLGFELEFALIATPSKTRDLVFNDEKDRLHTRGLSLLRLCIEHRLNEFCDTPPPVHVIPVVPLSPALLPDDPNTFWICKQEHNIQVSGAETHGNALILGIEITSPVYLDVNKENRTQWRLQIESVLQTISYFQADLRARGRPIDETATFKQTAYSVFDCLEGDEEAGMMARVDALIKPDPAIPLDSDLRFYLTAPHSAGVHVHIGNGESSAATLADDTVKNIAFLFWAYEATIDAFHMNHRGVMALHPAIRPFAATEVFPSPNDPDFVTRLEILYDSDVKGLVKRFTCGSKMWKVNFATNHHTIEFRQLASTFTASYVEDWAQFVLALVRQASRMTKNDILEVVLTEKPLHEVVGHEVCHAIRESKGEHSKRDVW